MVVLQLILWALEDPSDGSAERHVSAARTASPRRNGEQAEEHKFSVSGRPVNTTRKLLNTLDEGFTATQLVETAPEGQALNNMRREDAETHQPTKSLGRICCKRRAGSHSCWIRTCYKDMVGVFGISPTEGTRGARRSFDPALSTEP